MSRAVARRGPDDDGTWLDDAPGVVLVHRRLAIVDLSHEGHQPMVSADGRWVLAFNGEVYDHQDHRRHLVGAGRRLRGASDTEVLLELIARHGPESAFGMVDAMFALALWDRETRQLVLARDRLGEKPLLYGRNEGRVAFGSDLSALACLSGPTPSLDTTALGEFLRLGFVPAPWSIMSGVSKVPPGCLVRLHADGHVDDPVRYWALESVATSGQSAKMRRGVSEIELVEEFESVLRRSVRRRLMADVPVGAFLSGGLDSSIVVLLAQAESHTPVRTFTVSVGGQGDEARHAERIARHLGTDHTTLPLDGNSALSLATRMREVYDEPFADPSGIPTALLCQATRSHVTVALSGDGGDEMFAGYNRYRVADAGGVGRLLALPRPVRRSLARLVTRVPGPAWDAVGRRTGIPAAADKVQKLAAVLDVDDRLQAYQVLARQWDPRDVLAESAVDPTPSLTSDGSALGPLEMMLLLDQQVTLPDDMLVKVDRASMAVALEVRVPFLAPELVELSWQMPRHVKVRDGQGKWIVRQTLARHVPRELWDRPKIGFDPPLADWLRGPLREWAEDLLAPDRLRRQGLLRPDVVASVWREHLYGRRNHDYRLWTLLTLQSWLDRAPAHASTSGVAR
jgi:asparagine synthase (glutamine-hydrolysing)